MSLADAPSLAAMAFNSSAELPEMQLLGDISTCGATAEVFARPRPTRDMYQEATAPWQRLESSLPPPQLPGLAMHAPQSAAHRSTDRRTSLAGQASKR